MLLEERQKWREDEKEDGSSYWMTLRKWKIVETEKGNTDHPLWEVALEEAMDQS